MPIKFNPGQQVSNHPGNLSSARLPFLLYYPDIEQQIKPVLVFLHGVGEAGRARDNKPQDLEVLTAPHLMAPPCLCTQPGWNQPFIIVSPQLPDRTARWWQPEHCEAVLEIVNRVIEELQGDCQRVFLTGFSIGGLGVYALAHHAQGTKGHGIHFKKLLPVDPYNRAEENPRMWNLPAAGTVNIPTWAHHTKRNEEAASSFFNLIPHPNRKAPNSYELSHNDCCKYTYTNKEVYDWFLE